MKKITGIIIVLVVLVMGFLWNKNRSTQENGTPVTSNEMTYSASKFSVTLPRDYTIDEQYTYQALGPGKDIKGVKFTIPKSLATGTNLSPDTYMSIEELPLSVCLAGPFMMSGGKSENKTDGGVTYSVASSTDAAAGNRYEETVFAFAQSGNPCLAVRYFIHYGVYENYPADTVTEFNKASLLKAFDAIRKTVRLTQAA